MYLIVLGNIDAASIVAISGDATFVSKTEKGIAFYILSDDLPGDVCVFPRCILTRHVLFRDFNNYYCVYQLKTKMVSRVNVKVS